MAFLDENKIITISINKYGEQYFDIIAIFVLWSICLISLFFLIKTLREEIFLKEKTYKIEKESVLNKESHFYNLNPNIKMDNKKAPFIGYVSKSDNIIKQKIKKRK